MPTAMTSDHNVVFTRRGDPDPPVSVGEAYDATSNYEYTWIRVGPVRIKMYADRNRARRTLQHLLDELKEKTVSLAKAPEPQAGEANFSEDPPAFSRGAELHPVGGKRSRVGGGRKK